MRTSTFVNTFTDRNDPKIHDLRKRVKDTNKILKERGSKNRYSIKLRGRGPRITDYNVWYVTNKTGCNYPQAIAKLQQELPLFLSESYDVYIHARKIKQKNI